jgi:hypothetical protein
MVGRLCLALSVEVLCVTCDVPGRACLPVYSTDPRIDLSEVVTKLTYLVNILAFFG